MGMSISVEETTAKKKHRQPFSNLSKQCLISFSQMPSFGRLTKATMGVPLPLCRPFLNFSALLEVVVEF